jgi:23S rRNA (cytidine1920-2'-O)/16S rRNA (cytidine1409-2'-O)-methyltransferase
MKQRLDLLLVERGLADTREQARVLIMARKVRVDGQWRDKLGHAYDPGCRIECRERMPYASCGGFKLAAALDRFGLDVRGRACLDVGASTGGFTDCLLQRGAARVCALDVGHGQLDWKLRNDPRVEVREGVNARYLQSSDFSGPFGLAVCDASFISATLLIPAIAPLLDERGEMVILVKPQFEVGKRAVGRGGVVRDPALHRAACDRVRATTERLGCVVEMMESPILGAEGNREFLLYARRP